MLEAVMFAIVLVGALFVGLFLFFAILTRQLIAAALIASIIGAISIVPASAGAILGWLALLE